LTAALQYRLVSPWTNWLVVAPSSEDEKAYDVPILHNAIQKSDSRRILDDFRIALAPR